MKNIFKGLLVAVVIYGAGYGIYYVKDQYQMKKINDAIQATDFVSINQLDKLSIIQYPELQTYVSFDGAEMQDTYRTLKVLDNNDMKLKNTSRFQMSESYMKIRFSEDGGHSFIEYLIYDNGYISRAEDALAVSKYAYYKVDEAQLKEIRDELLTRKTLE